MRPSLKLGRILGVDVGVHWSVLVIAGLLAFGLTGGVGDFELWVVAIFAVVVFLASLLAHELAHSIVARRNGMEVKGITLWLLGGVAQLGGPMPNAGAELRVAAAGPATSLALGAVFVLLAIGAAATGFFSTLFVSALGWLGFVNVVLALFNLIPAAPLDGGRILAGTLWAIRKDRHRAEIVATQAGRIVGFGFIGLGLAGLVVDIPFVSIWTALLGWFILTTATAEQRHARMSRSFGARRVRDVMTPDPETVRGWMTVEAFADEARLSPPRHTAYPVEAWEGGIAGVVTVGALKAVPWDQLRSTRVIDAAVPLASVTVAAPDEPLQEVVDRASDGRLPYVLVMTDDRLVGVVTPTDLVKDEPDASAAHRS